MFLGYGMSGWNYDLKLFYFIDGIVIILVMGMFVYKFSYLSLWVIGYNVIVGMFDVVNVDFDVEGILFVINLFGGIVVGCFDVIDYIV